MTLRLVPGTGDELEPSHGLTSSNVVAAALQLADLGGLDCVTHVQLATIFGAPTQSIHALFLTRGELIDALCDRAAELLSFPSALADWQGWVQATSAGLHDLSARHPGAVEALALRPIPAYVLDAGMDVLELEGMTLARIEEITTSVWAAFIGMALQEAISPGAPWAWLTDVMLIGVGAELPHRQAQIRMLPPV